MNATKKTLTSAAILLAVAGAQAAATYHSTATGQNSAGGTINWIDSSFDTLTNQFTFSSNYSSAAGSLKTDGFWLVVTNGPNPKGISNQLAVFYLDASGSEPKLTTYAYNGVNGANSYKNGDGFGGEPDQISSSLLSTDWIKSVTKQDNADGTRTLGFDIDASVINGHDPAYGPQSDWEGARFDSKIGVWLHPTTGTKATYKDGFLSSFTSKSEGSFDSEDQDCQPVPEPASWAALGVGVASLARRRRRR